MANRNSLFSIGAARRPGRPHWTPASLLVLTLSLLSCQSPPEAVRPNLIVIFCDDLGYGDLGSFGHPTIRTPNLDRMAREGQKWTHFYSAASVCTPSRAALLTGRLPVRNGMMSPKHRVLFPDSASGIPQEEVTLAEALRNAGYATACVGKWHLGHLPQFLPTNNGFDSYFGIPYSNDMDQTRKESTRDLVKEARIEYWNVPLLRDREIVERPADQRTITRRYSEEAVRFIEENRERPFFLYLAHNLPHVPLFASEDFLGTSRRGLYGDVVEEIDHGVGRIMQALTGLGIAERTLVVFTSDNGPWLPYREHGGSAGLLREGKGSTWEGGMREPTIFWWPGKLDAGVVMEMGSTLDLFSTFCEIAGAEVPSDRIMDSYDLSPVLFGSGESPRKSMFFYRESKLYAVRQGEFKAHFITKPVYTRRTETETHHDPPLLYHLGRDPGEQYDVAHLYPDVIQDMEKLVSDHRSEMVLGEDRLAQRSQDAKR
ncbi:MAG: sulfatase [Candidatus Aminicenantes bacterium]|nr:sulfatase [Candidatus Aminicenantes bacterium]